MTKKNKLTNEFCSTIMNATIYNKHAKKYLTQYDYPAAGHPNTGFAVDPHALARAAGGRICSVIEHNEGA